MDSLRYGALCLFALLFCGYGFSYDPVEFLASETHLLEEGEVPKNIILIGKGEQNYHVVRVMVGEETSAYFALKESVKEVVTEEVLNKQLFQTAEFISNYQEFKQDVKENPALIWFIVNWGEVSTIITKVSDEELDLMLIKSTLSGSSANQIVSEMESRLSAIQTTLNVLKEKMSATDTLEGSFIQPETVVGGETGLKDAIIECYSYLDALNSMKLEYETLKKSLEVAIADDPELAPETKQQLSEAANLPAEFTKIENWFTSAQNMQLEKSLGSALLNASNSSSNFASLIDNRLKRETAFIALYSEDSELKKKTEYISLKDAFEQMTNAEIADYWVEQEKLDELFQEWKRAEVKFENKDYDRAVLAAGKAKKAAIAAYEGGFVKQNGDEIDLGLLFTGAVLIIILLIILIIIRKRDALKAFIGGSEEEESVVFNEFP